MSITVNANTYSNAVNAYAYAASAASKTKSVTEQLGQTLQVDTSSKYDSFEMVTSTEHQEIDTSELVKLLKEGTDIPGIGHQFKYFTNEYRDKVISAPDLLICDYKQYISLNGSSISVEDKVFYYEKARDEILKTFENDEELLNAHLTAIDNAFKYALRDVAFYTAMRLWAQNCMARQYENEGVKFEANKLAVNKDFKTEEFMVNAHKTLQNFAKEFLNNIKTGQNYADAKKTAFDYMAENFKTTTVNSLSFNDLITTGQILCGNGKRVVDKAETIAQFSEINKKFNESKELSAELRALLG